MSVDRGRNKQIIADALVMDDNEQDIHQAALISREESRVGDILKARRIANGRRIIAEFRCLIDDIESKGIKRGSVLFRKVLGKCLASRIQRRRLVGEMTDESPIAEGWRAELQGSMGGEPDFEAMSLEQNPDLKRYKP